MSTFLAGLGAGLVVGLSGGFLATAWAAYRTGYEEHRRESLGRLYEVVRAAGRTGAMEEDR